MCRDDARTGTSANGCNSSTLSDCFGLHFCPEQNICAVLTLLRHRGELVKAASEHVQHMHKALTQMNLQIHHVINDITGQTGLAIVDAILAGERDAAELAKLRNYRIRANAKIIRLAAFSLHHSPTPLGSYLRRMKAKMGPAAATTATAHKIAVIFYTIVKKQVEYDETIGASRDAQREQRIHNKLKRQAKQFGYQLVPIENSAA